MRPSLLFDTSAFKALPTRQMDAASRSATLYASPFCFWEMLTHLGHDEPFKRVKGNLMKFRHVAVLDDPDAEVRRLVLPSSNNVHTRVRDGDLVCAALAALEDSESLQDFYGRIIRDESGQHRQIAGCVSAVQSVLQSKENRFQTLLRKIAVAVRSGQVRVMEASDFDQGVRDLCHNWRLQVCGGANDATLVEERVLRATYIYHAYLLHRAIEYAAGARPDPNDFEDARLCLHLGLRDFTAVVTNDTDLRSCLEASLGALNAMEGATRHTRLQVWDTPAFAAGLTYLSTPCGN
jgi:hypothetical protein